MSDSFNEFGVFFINLYFVCLFIGLIYYPYDIFINKYLCNSCYITEFLSKILNFLGLQFPNYTYLLFLIFLILYLILYAFYLIIIYIIPETGLPTLFIPARELLLAIPPLPILINKKVFYMFDLFFKFIGARINFKEFITNYFSFSKDNIIENLRIFNPNIDLLLDNIESTDDNNKNGGKRNKGSGNNGDNEDNQDHEEDNYEERNSKTDVDICVNSQAPITTPNMNFIDLIINEIKNTKNNIKCNLNSIKYYIKSSASNATMNAKDKIK
jgi:hypothetical protein